MMAQHRKWGGGMLLEPVRSRRRGAAPGAGEVPEGVVDPLTMAGTVMGDYRRAETVRRWAERHRRTEIITIMGTPVPARELRGRAAVLDEVRRGNPQAARQLWETRRAWIITPASEGVGGREIPAQRPARVATRRSAGTGVHGRDDAPTSGHLSGPGPSRPRGD